MIKQLYILAIFLILVLQKSYGQDNFYFSQYFQMSQAINPGFAGINNFLDMKINHRNQWAGFSDSPTTNFISINSHLKKESQLTFKEYALRISNVDILDSLSNLKNSFKNQMKSGVGGYLVYDTQGPFEQISGFLNYAIHLPISFKTRLAIGASAGIVNNRLNFEKISLRDPDNDDYYQQLLAQGGRNTYFDINPGLVLYSNSWFLSYAAHKAIRKPLSSDEVMDYDKTIDHHIIAGLKINMGDKNRLVPSVYVVHNDKTNSYWESNIRAVFNEKPWFGVSYRSTKALVFMAGIFANNMFNISYSYDYLISDLNNYANGSHELHLGLMLNKKDLKTPYLW